jgi:hypothetical protein
MKALLATVEHSGTRFVLELFNLTKRAALLEREDQCTGAAILYAHLTDDQMPLIRDAARRMPVITTYREPRLIRASWERRNRDLRALDEQFKNYEELLTFRPAVVTLWGGFERLPPPYMWFQNPSPQKVDEQLIRQPGFRM